MTDTHSISGGGLTATIRAEGAELCRLTAPDGTEMLWDAGPEWRRHAPVLFPIVGKLAGDTLRHQGVAHRMTQHGFARDRRFAWRERGPDHARLVLEDDADSRGLYPFRFRLEVLYLAGPSGLAVTVTVGNPGPEALPFAIGAHPAFRWPLRPGLAKEAHSLTFAAEETGAAHYLAGGLLGPPEVSPIEGRRVALTPGLFARDAVILPRIASRAVRFAAEGGPALRVTWEGYRDLGLWSKPEGADFLCIEPWCGMASPAGWDGEFRDKPGILTLAPGEARDFTWGVAWEG